MHGTGLLEANLTIADVRTAAARIAGAVVRTPTLHSITLSAITGAGKTPILAQAVSLMRGHFGIEPIVLWMSKARSVVAQTYTNFSGGKYSELVDGFRVINIQNINPDLIADGTIPLLLMTGEVTRMRALSLQTRIMAENNYKK